MMQSSNFNATDSIWSQQFLFDYFSSPSSKKEKKEGIDLDIKKVELTRVVFMKKDGWLGHDMIIRAGKLDLDADEIDLSRKLINARSLSVAQPIVSLNNYQWCQAAKKQGYFRSTSDDNSLKTADSLIRWNPDGWMMHVNNLKIEDGTFRNDKQSATPPLAWFDGRHIDFHQIDLGFSECNLVQRHDYGPPRSKDQRTKWLRSERNAGRC